MSRRLLQPLALLALLTAPLAAGAQSSADHSASGEAAAPRVARNGEVTDLVVKGKSLEVRYRNTGAEPTAILGELQVRSEDDSLLLAVPLVEDRVVKAGREEKLRVPMPALPRGRYVLYAVVSYGGDTLTAAQAALEIR